MAFITSDDDLFIGWSYDSSNADNVDALIDASCQAVETYCGRSFGQANYTELAQTSFNGSLILKNPPVAYVSQVAKYLHNVLSITGTGEAYTTDTSLVVSGNELLYSTYTTLSALATAISALSGFTASVESDYANVSSTDLVSGRYVTIDTSQYFPIWFKSSISQVDSTSGILYGLYSCTLYRVKYRGGYATVPADIKYVVSQMVKRNYANIPGPLLSEGLAGQYYYTVDRQNTPINELVILNRYKLSVV